MAIVKRESFLHPFFRWPEIWEEEWPEISTARDLSIYETDKDIVVEAPIPGVPAEKVEVTVEDGVLTIKGGHEETEEEKKKKKVVYRAARRASFNYATSLPRAAEEGKAKAEVEDGIVKVTIPKAKKEKPKTVKVKAKGKK